MFCTEIKAGYHASGASSGVDEADVDTFTLDSCEVTLVVTDSLGVNYDQFFARLSHSQDSQLESVNLLVIGYIPEVRSMHMLVRKGLLH